MDAELALARVGLSLGSVGRKRSDQDAQENVPPPEPHLIEAMSAFLTALGNANRSPETIRAYGAALRLFGHWLSVHYSEARCSDLSHSMVEGFVRYLRHEFITRNGRRLSDRSLNLYVATLKIFSNWGARGRRFWPISPLWDYQVPGYVEREIEPLTHEELRTLLNECGSEHSFMGRRLRALFLVALDTGMRRGELRKVTMEMIDLRSGAIRLPAAITKTRRSRTVHLQQTALTAVKSWFVARNVLPGMDPLSGPLFCEASGQPISDAAMQELAVRLRIRSGIQRFHWHLMRHTSGTEALRNGADSLDVQETLGHTTSAMTRRYLHLTDEDRRQRHAKYSPVQGLLNKTEPRENRFKRRSA